MDIITRIPAAYFIYIEDEVYQYSRWLNLAHVQEVVQTENYLQICLEGDKKIKLNGKAKEQFLNELQLLNKRYTVSLT